MPTTGFDVNDEGARESFLQHELPGAIERLSSASTPRWGRMRAQEMVEHLIWAFALSNGVTHVSCSVPASELPRLKQFLYSNRPTPREFMNPALVNGLPPLRHGTLEEAKTALKRELARFLDGPRLADQVHTHPVFGRMGYAEWHRAHCKHVHHHLLQFGLIESESLAPEAP
jgi:oxepin-CoA hydrolase/3-oxo-5,6-dehydrosuberyl-CoA semialdehyde dehydrogenase